MYHLSEYYHGGYCADEGPEKASGIGGVGGDHFIVEDIFDFSKGDGIGNGGGEEEDDGVFHAVTGNLAESDVAASGGNYCSSTSFGEAHFSDNLCEPYEESAELEWLSNFVEDCFSNKIDIQKLHPISQTSSETTQDSSPSAKPVPVTAKARSKRSRGGPGSWASRLPPVLTSSLSVASTLPSPPPSSPSEKPPRRYASATDGHKCLHCGSDKTPQWRTGPMGPKTLCNACGVRYKSGRLVPEYRPAASPTFVVSEHSNSHRKVVELRRQKEMQMQQHQQVLYWS